MGISRTYDNLEEVSRRSTAVSDNSLVSELLFLAERPITGVMKDRFSDLLSPHLAHLLVLRSPRPRLRWQPPRRPRTRRRACGHRPPRTRTGPHRRRCTARRGRPWCTGSASCITSSLKGCDDRTSTVITEDNRRPHLVFDFHPDTTIATNHFPVLGWIVVLVPG